MKIGPGRVRTVERLHVGCGAAARKAWWNLDIKPVPGADQVLDVCGGLNLRGVRFIYAEHLLEHLPFERAFAFLQECRRVLEPGGVLRATTPNLDWVQQTHYRPASWRGEEEAVDDCLRLNRAFRGWGHQFLYNAPTLSALLRTAGFGAVEFRAHGESSSPELRNIDHPRDRPDRAELPRALAVEASKIDAGGALPERLVAEYSEAVNCR